MSIMPKVKVRVSWWKPTTWFSSWKYELLEKWSYQTGITGYYIKALITEGKQYNTLSITPKSTTSTVEVVVDAGMLSGGSAMYITTALFIVGTSEAVAENVVYIPGVNQAQAPTLIYSFVPGSLTPITFTVRIGQSTGTMFINGHNGGRIGGGAVGLRMSATEIA